LAEQGLEILLMLGDASDKRIGIREGILHLLSRLALRIAFGAEQQANKNGGDKHGQGAGCPD
jgi:hypothetical protein